MRRSRCLVALVVGGLAATWGCDKEDTPTPAPVSLASNPPPPPLPPSVWHIVIAPDVAVHLEMKAASEQFVADTTIGQGAVDITATNLAITRGAIDVDLASLATKTFGNADDAKQTKEALSWFEVAHDDSVRWAHFAIQSVDGLSATDLTTVAATQDGKDDVRTVTMTVHGDLLIHKHKVAKTAKIDVTFRHPHGTFPAMPPTHVDIKTTEPMVVTRKEVDVEPRDPKGKVVKIAAGLVGRVAGSAEVSVSAHSVP